MRRAAAAAVALLALFAAVLTPAAGARQARESWGPKKASGSCPAKRRACHRWRAAFPRTAPVLGGGQQGAPASPSEPAPVNPLGRSLQVRASEFALVLSRTEVAAGDVMVEFNTLSAEDPHDLKLRSTTGGVARTLFDVTAAELLPPPRESFSIAAGAYVLFCSLPGHEALGMRANLGVR